MNPALLSPLTILAQAAVDAAPQGTAAAGNAAAVAATMYVDPLPAAAIAFLFVVNIITLGYFLGGLILTTLCEMRSKRQAALFILAKAIHHAVFNLHPLVIVLVIVPLVIANGFYFLYLISIGSPTLGSWGMMVPLAALWLMLACMHRFSWPDRGGYEPSHAYTGLIATSIAAVLPLFYLLWISPAAEPAANIGAALLTAIPRWLHMLLMAVAGTSLLLAWRLGSADSSLAWAGAKMLAELRRRLLRISLIALVAQFVAAILVLMTMHFEFMSISMGAFLALGMVACVITMVMLSADVNSTGQRVGRFLPQTTTMMVLAVLAMAMTRHAYQANAAGPGANAALMQAKKNLEPDDSPEVRAMPGRQLFITHCNVCHSAATLAPSVSEIASIYGNDADALVRWAKHPGRKRAKFGPMPPMSHIRDRSLEKIAEYMIASGAPKEVEQAEPLPTKNPSTP